MKVIRWFLSHIILILLVVAVIYGYMFWGNLLGEKTPAGKAIAYLSGEFTVVAEFVEAVKEKQAQLSSENKGSGQADESVVASSDRSPATTSQVPAVPVQPVPVQSRPVQSRPVQPMPVQPMSVQPMPGQQRASAPAFTQPGPAPQPMSNRQGNESPSRIQSPADTGSSSSSPSISDGVAGALVPSAPKRSDVFISDTVEEQLDNVDGSGKVIDTSLQVTNVRDSWIAARKAYYQRKYDVSEQSYQDVIDNTQDNFDAYGELGNVYFNQGKNKQAAAAYFSAASIMISKGQVNRARGLLGLLRHLDKDKADELQKLITSATS
jgi:tetratricopeptide (TPR) repeat protein